MLLRARALVPFYPLTYAGTFPREGIVLLRARAFTPLISEIRVIEDGVRLSNQVPCWYAWEDLVSESKVIRIR